MATAKRNAVSTGSGNSKKSNTLGAVIAAKGTAAKTQGRTKQSPPIRLSGAFYKRMNAAATINSRSVPKHLEHLVNIAESIRGQVSREEILDVQSGLSKIVIEKTEALRINKSTLFGSLERLRKSGALSKAVTAAKTKYQASASHPGQLERINDNGIREIGMFKGGKFKVAKGLA